MICASHPDACPFAHRDHHYLCHPRKSGTVHPPGCAMFGTCWDDQCCGCDCGYCFGDECLEEWPVKDCKGRALSEGRCA